MPMVRSIALCLVILVMVIGLTPHGLRAMQETPTPNSQAIPYGVLADVTRHFRAMENRPHGSNYIFVSVTVFNSLYLAESTMQQMVASLPSVDIDNAEPFQLASVGDLGDKSQAYIHKRWSNDSESYGGMLVWRDGGNVYVAYALGPGEDPLRELFAIGQTITGRRFEDTPVLTSVPHTGGVWDLLPTLSDIPEGFVFVKDSNSLEADSAAQEERLPAEAAQSAGQEEHLSLDARLGGTVESWQVEFGIPIERDGEHADLFTEYAIPDFSTVYADDYLGRIDRITLFAPRPEGEEWSSASHAMNWSVEDAHEIAEAFLPRDATLEALPRGEGSDLDQVLCTSDALSTDVSQEVYDYVDYTPQYGRCSYVLMHEDGGDGDRIGSIIITLEIEEPLT